MTKTKGAEALTTQALLTEFEGHVFGRREIREFFAAVAEGSIELSQEELGLYREQTCKAKNMVHREAALDLLRAKREEATAPPVNYQQVGMSFVSPEFQEIAKSGEPPTLPATKTDKEACIEDLKTILATQRHSKQSAADQADLYDRAEAICSLYGQSIDEIRKCGVWLPQKPKKPEGPQKARDLNSKEIAHWSTKQLQPLMEYPFFRLSSKVNPKEKIVRYGDIKGKGPYIELTASGYGWATFLDQAILVFCVSHMTAASNRGDKITKTIETTGDEILCAIHRRDKSSFGGNDYKELKAAFDRLKGMGVKTNIPQPFDREVETESKPAHKPTTSTVKNTGLVDLIEYIDDHLTSKVGRVKITISEWAFGFILEKKHLLTLHDDYLYLKSPLEVRLYEVGYKRAKGITNSAGDPLAVPMPVKEFYSRSGTSQVFKYFNRDLKEFFGGQTKKILDLNIQYDTNGKKLIFCRENTG